MLKAVYHKDFKRDFKKLPKKIQEKFNQQFLQFIKNPKNLILRDHPLTGALRGKRAFSVTGDVRAIYRYVDQDTILLLRIGTHNQVYN